MKRIEQSDVSKKFLEPEISLNRHVYIRSTRTYTCCARITRCTSSECVRITYPPPSLPPPLSSRDVRSSKPLARLLDPRPSPPPPGGGGGNLVAPLPSMPRWWAKTGCLLRLSPPWHFAGITVACPLFSLAAHFSRWRIRWRAHWRPMTTMTTCRVSSIT